MARWCMSHIRLVNRKGRVRIPGKPLALEASWYLRHSYTMTAGGFDSPRGHLYSCYDIRMKTCTKCLETKPTSEFSMKRGQPQSRCKTCHSAYYKEYYSNAENRAKHLERLTRNQKRAHRESLGFFSEESYEEFRRRNGGICELCNSKPSRVLDHNHTTGKPRGMLCTGCNTGIGQLGDNLEGLERAMEYLRSNPG
jgi:hypothetical protein